MEVQTAQNGRATVTSVKRLVLPISKCVFLFVVLSISTGPLIRELVLLSLSDLLAFTIGLLWLIGDIIPCIALSATLYDIVLIRKRDGVNLLSFKGRCVPLSDLILILFIVLYLFDFFIVCISYFTTSVYSTNRYTNLLGSYRYGFFNLQIFISILYITKPWAWRRFDLRNIVSNLERFYSLQLRMAESLSVYLQGSISDNEPTDNSNLQILRLKELPSRLERRGTCSSQARKSAKRGKTSRSLKPRNNARSKSVSRPLRARKSVKRIRISRSSRARKSVKMGKSSRSLRHQKSIEKAKSSVSGRAKHTTLLIVKHVLDH